MLFFTINNNITFLMDRGFTLLDTALDLGFSAANRKLNFRNDTSENAAVVLVVKK